MKHRVYAKEKKTKKSGASKLLKRRVSRLLKRHVHIDGKEWGWQFKKGDPELWNCSVTILSPDNKYFTVYAKEIGYDILPSVIKQFIIDKFIQVNVL